MQKKDVRQGSWVKLYLFFFMTNLLNSHTSYRNKISFKPYNLLNNRLFSGSIETFNLPFSLDPSNDLFGVNIVYYSYSKSSEESEL